MDVLSRQFAHTCVLCNHLMFFAEFAQLYERLGVTLTERGESFYNSLMPEVVAELEGKSEFSSHTA